MSRAASRPRRAAAALALRSWTRWRRLLLARACGAIALLTLAAGCTGSASPSDAEPASLQDGRFTTFPNPCSLLDEALVRDLTEELHGSELETSSRYYQRAPEPSGICNRYFADPDAVDRGEPLDRRLVFALQVHRGDPGDESGIPPALTASEEARRDFTSLAETFDVSPRAAPPDLRGIADEVAVGYDRGGDDAPGGGFAVFRISNLVVDVQYSGANGASDVDGTPMDPDEAVEGTKRIASSVAQALRE